MGGDASSRESAQRYILEAILESPRDIVIIALDREYRYLAFNDAHRRVMKQIWNVDIYVGQNMLYDVVGRDDDRVRAKQNFDRALAGEHFVRIEAFGDETFSRRYYEDAYGPIIDADGAVIGLTIYLTDITQQKLAQDQLEQYRLRLESLVEERTAALRRSEALYRTLVLNAPIAAMVHRDGRILFVNPAAVALSADADADELASRSLLDITDAAVVKRLESGERLTSAEVPFKRSNGTRADVEWTSIPVDFDGRPAIFSLVLDVSARKRMELERRRLEDQMRHAQKLESLGVLAGGIAHDFNNLLVGILGNADLALRGLDEEERADEESLRLQLGRIKLAATRAAELTGRMLAYAGKGPFVLRPLDLNMLASEMVDLMNVSVSKSATLVLDLASNLPPFEGDVVQIRQILMNLVTNAADAVGDAAGRITLRTSLVDAAPDLLASMVVRGDLVPGRYVSLEVADTGRGMDARTRANMFDPFFTTKQSGRGLGLAAVLGIVRSHHGGLTVESEVGRGSTFRVLFPCTARVPATVATPPAAQEWRGSGTVLLADDEPRVREVLKMMMRDVGFEVLESANTAACLDVYREHRGEIALLVVDLMMPGGGGRKVVSTIRAEGDRVPIIVSSGYSEDAVGPELRSDPLVAFLEKPYDFDTFMRTVGDILEAKKTLGQDDVSWAASSDPPRSA